jgi:hypothetical protein
MKIRDKKGNIRFVVEDSGEVKEKPLLIQDEKKVPPPTKEK